MERSNDIYIHYSQKLTNHDHGSNIHVVCRIGQRLLESERPFNSQQFDTSFQQIGKKNVNEVTIVMQMAQK